MAIKFTELKETYRRLPPARKTPEVKQFMCDLIQVEIDKAPKRGLDALSKLSRYLRRELESQEPTVVLLRPTDDTGETGDEVILVDLCEGGLNERAKENGQSDEVSIYPTEDVRIACDNEQDVQALLKRAETAANRTADYAKEIVDDPDVKDDIKEALHDLNSDSQLNLDACGDYTEDDNDDDDLKAVEELAKENEQMADDAKNLLAVGMTSILAQRAKRAADLAVAMQEAAERAVDTEDATEWQEVLTTWGVQSKAFAQVIGDLQTLAGRQVEFHNSPIVRRGEVD